MQIVETFKLINFNVYIKFVIRITPTNIRPGSKSIFTHSFQQIQPLQYLFTSPYIRLIIT